MEKAHHFQQTCLLGIPQMIYYANDLLSDKKFSKLVVEIAFMPGVALRQGTINETKTFLEERLNKPNGIDIVTNEIPSGGKSQYSAEDIRDIENKERTVFPDNNTLSIWICVVDGEYVNRNVLGIAYHNLSCALMGGTIANNSGGLSRPSREKIETTIMHHELGHLLGLVDVGTPMVDNHKGEEAHCNNSNCLMYHSVETVEFLSVLLSQPVPTLDDKCLADLRNNGGK